MIGGNGAMTEAHRAADCVFDLDGGRTCLDFANTLDSSGDHLGSYADLVAFSAQSKLLTRDDADWLRDEGLRDRVSAEAVMVRARGLRSVIYAIFSAVAAGKATRERDVGHLNLELAATLPHARVFPSGSSDRYYWGWAGSTPDAPLWGVIRSAADLLTSEEDMRRVRECNGVECQWLFLDTSKNHTRQWCSMQSCGNRQKARRHYQRSRDRQKSRPLSTGEEAADGPRGV